MDAHPGDTTVSLLLKYLPAGVVVHGPDTSIHLANEGAAALLGLTLDELMGKTATDKTWSFVREDGSPMPVDEFPVYHVIRTGEPVRDMAVGINRSSTNDRVWVQVSAYPEWDGNNELQRIVAVFTDITARIRAERSLVESEQRWSHTFHTNPLAQIITTYPEGRVVEVNNAFSTLMGYSRDEMIGRTTRDIDFWVDGADRTAALDAFRRDGRILGREIRYRIRSGEIRDMIASVEPIQFDGLSCLISTMMDNTERKRAAQAVQASKAQLEAALSSMTDAVFLSDIHGEFLLFNDAFAGFHRFTDRSECRRTLEEYPDLLDVAFPDGTPAPLDAWAVPRALRGEVVTNAEYILRRKDTGESWVGSYSFGPIRDADGIITGSVTVCRDITEQKIREEELRQLNAELEKRVQERTAELTDLYNNAPCAYHSIDHTGLVVHINDTELRWLGYTRDEVVGKKNIVDILTPASVEIFRAVFPVFLAKGRQDNVEVELLRKDGSALPVLLNATAVFDDTGRFLMSRSTMIDFTERREAHTRLMEIQKQLEASNGELEAFSYSVSHDLRAPLRAIEGFTRILLDEYGDTFDAEQKRLFSVVSSNARKMDRLITDLLSLSKISRAMLRVTRIDMDALARDVFNDIAPAELRGNIALQIGPLPAAFGDPTQLRQVWSNLLSNAVTYTGPKPERRIEIGARDEDAETVYHVHDNGVGFDPRFAGKLFGIFQRLHSSEEFQGTGVGLAIVQRIVARHGGRVWAEGALGEGATFYFTLPRAGAIPDADTY